MTESPSEDPAVLEPAAEPAEESIPPSADDARPSTSPPSDGSKRAWAERSLPDFIKRGLEKGIEAGIHTFARADGPLRGVMADARLPREMAGYLLGQVDETKNALLKAVSKEVRDFLRATDIAKELRRALTSLSFQVTTEVRFVPNEDGTVRPNVRTLTGTVRKKKSKPRKRTPKAP